MAEAIRSVTDPACAAGAGPPAGSGAGAGPKPQHILAWEQDNAAGLKALRDYWEEVGNPLAAHLAQPDPGSRW
jgi:hypothetical protein